MEIGVEIEDAPASQFRVPRDIPPFLADKRLSEQLRFEAVDATVIRHRALSALIVGATGLNVLRVVTAFESKRILTLREDTIAAACDRIGVEMPNVVLLLVPPVDAAEHEALSDRALAVGALVVHIDPALDAESFKELLENTVKAALERKIRRETAESQDRGTGASDVPPDELDAGWNE